MAYASKAHSRWECKCGYTYESPVAGTGAVSHTSKARYEAAHKLKRVWRSPQDRRSD